MNVPSLKRSYLETKITRKSDNANKKTKVSNGSSNRSTSAPFISSKIAASIKANPKGAAAQKIKPRILNNIHTIFNTLDSNTGSQSSTIHTLNTVKLNSYPLASRFEAYLSKHAKKHNQPGSICTFMLPEEIKYVNDVGLDAIRKRVFTVLRQNVGQAHPYHDGSQTPYHSKDGSPISVAQHGTRTCCRACIESYHHIASGQALTDTHINILTDVVIQWIRHHAQTPCRRS